MSNATRFLEFVNLKTGEVGNRVNVTGCSDRSVEQCLRGMLINKHEDWFVRDTADTDEPSYYSDEEMEAGAIDARPRK